MSLIRLPREDNSDCKGSECYGIPSHGLPMGAIIAIVVVVFLVLATIIGFGTWMTIRRASRRSKERYERDYYYRYDAARRSQMTETVFSGTTTFTAAPSEKHHSAGSIVELPRPAHVR